MSLRKNSEIDFINGDEGTKIKQYFHPHNTLNGINYSLAQFTLESGKKSKRHKMKSYRNLLYFRRLRETNN